VGDRTPIRFLVLLAAWGLAATAVLTSTPVMASVVVPFSRWQGTVVAWYLGVGSLPVSVVPSCSGLDAMSLCVAAVMAFPRAWRQRLAGAGIGLVWILLVNLARVASLAAAVDSAWFDLLHVVVWPTLLILATVGWVFLWLRVTERPADARPHDIGSSRLVAWSAVCLGVYALIIPVLSAWQVLDLFARDLAAVAVATLTTVGIEAAVAGNLITAGGQPYLVTSECVTTPLMALYVAAVAATPMRLTARLAWLAAFAPVFITLAVLRLLTVASPPLLFGSPLFVTHAFHQLVLAVVIVSLLARHWSSAASRPALVTLVGGALAGGIAAGVVGGEAYTQGLLAGLSQLGLSGATALGVPAARDLQGVIASLPAFQLALFVALVLAVRHRVPLRHAVYGLAALVALQAVTLAGVSSDVFDVSGTGAALALRGWALAAPAVIVATLARSGG
jgi:exosortase/archaeosortase family protein